MESEMNKILVFGGTGYIGKYMVKASITLGYPTFVYTRPINSQTPPSKIQLCEEFNSMGVTIVEGELEHEQIVAVIKQVDIVICTFPFPQVMDQLKIIDAIKVVGNIKRFFPSDFGVEEDKINPLPSFQAILDKKRKIRREIEVAGIPYTFVSANAFGAYFVNFLLRPYEKKKDILVYGNGETKAILNYEEDIALYTIKVANDPRTCNRIVVYCPSKNIITQNELISLWEQKSGQHFSKTFVSEEELVKLSQTLPSPENIRVSILHSLFVKGDLVNFELGEDDYEASQLYPDYNYTSIDQLLDKFLGELEHEQIVAVIKQVDIVICTLSFPQVLEQLKIIDAIKVAGNIKRFLPAEFGSEEDKITPLPPFEAVLEKKRKIRREIEAAGIPYTFVSANCFTAYFVNFLLRPYEKKNDIVVYGNGEIKAILNYEEDVAWYTIKVANDPRTCNRIVVYRPSKNIITQNELISLWQQKSGEHFCKTFVPEEELVKLSETLPSPDNIRVSLLHSVFVKGDLVNFELGEDDHEASQLYPDYNYTSIDQVLDNFLVDPPPPASTAFE